MSEVPLGVFLSGGIDSGLVTSFMNDGKSEINSFTIGFGGNTGTYDDERKYARLVAKKNNTHHNELSHLHSRVVPLSKGRPIRLFRIAHQSTIYSHYQCWCNY